MISDRMQRRIEKLLDEADEAIAGSRWDAVRDRARNVLALDPDNSEAHAFLQAADRALDGHDSPAENVAGRTGTGAPVASEPATFGRGRYTVKRFLGEGGKKRVYLAHDTTLARDVAFALIKTDGLDVEGRERITREAQAMGKLGTHPHVVSVFDMGSEGESPYLVTELMQGGDIEGLLEQAPEHRLTIPDAVSLAVQVCRGLEFAHSHGLVHRDLKPGNVWLTADGTAKIGDFGLAVSLDRSRLTRAGMMVGTVSYMPPEQAMGGEVSPRSDLYSLGAMLYEMVTGRPPFVGEESVAIITQHLNVPPVSPTWHRPDCPPGLEALILRLLEKDAAKRPASASAVLQALAGLQTETAPSTAAPAPAGDTGHLHDPLYQRVFVGRDSELRQLSAAFDAAGSGRGSLAMVVGEPGIGKTSLCEQLATYVAVRGGKTLVGHCYEEGSLSLPYLPFVEALRSYVLTREPDALRSELGSGATEVARIVSEVRDRVQVSPSAGGDPDEQRWRLLQAVSGFLHNAGNVQPLLIILEDLHDADRGTIDLLLHLSRNLQGARLLIVGTYRDVEVDRTHPLSSALAELRRAASFLRVPLRGLTVDEVQRMMSAIRGQEVPWSRAEAVHRQTEGNPLFVQEVLRYLVEEGLVVREGGRYVRADGGDPDAGIPEGLRDVIGKRLSRLSEKANQVLSVASVIGRDFRFDVLQGVSGLPDAELDTALEEASERALIESRPAVGTLAFRFTHAFFRQTLYDELFASRRLRLHQQVARALEALYGRRVEEHAAELAEHFAQSTDAADLAKALHYSEVAALRAMGVYAYGEAVRHLEQALKVLEVLDPDDAARRCDLLLALGEALMPAGELLRVAEHLAKEALALAEQRQDHGRASLACRLALMALRRYGRTLIANRSIFRDWIAAADRYATPGSTDRVYADLNLAWASRMVGQVQRDRELTAGALRLARALGDQEALLAAVQDALIRREDLEHEEEQFELMREFEGRFGAGLNPRMLAEFLFSSADGHLRWGNRARAGELYAELRALAARTGDPGVVLVSLRGDMNQATLDGRLEEAVNLASARIRAAEEGGIAEQAQRAGDANFCGRALILLGRAPDVVGLMSTDGRVAPLQQFVYAVALAHAGRAPEAMTYVRLREQQLLGEIPVSSAALLAEAALLCGDAETVRRLAPKIDGHSEIVPSVGLGPYATRRLLGNAAALLGDAERARGCYARALEVCERIKFRPEIALTRLDLAELLLQHYPNEQADAVAHLDFAIGEFREMKMQPALERALKHKGLLHA